MTRFNQKEFNEIVKIEKELNKPMNMTEARKLSKEKWGNWGFAKISRYNKRKFVGRKIIIGRYIEDERLGWGATWEEAFENAERKEDK